MKWRVGYDESNISDEIGSVQSGMTVDGTHFSIWVRQDLISIFEGLVEFYLEEITLLSQQIRSFHHGHMAGGQSQMLNV